MRSLAKIFTVFIIIINVSNFAIPTKAYAQVSVSFQVFYDELSPYGHWVDNPQYGYVWIPDVDPGFTPYGSEGYWVYTDVGWTWVSNYPWGWAPFHYGRWYYDPIYGYEWIPDTEWGPAWVTWRQSEGYYGWAPLEPGISISFAYSNGYNPPVQCWRFVHDRDFGRRDINNYYVNQTNNTTIIHNSTVIQNSQTDNSRHTKYIAGPDRNQVQKATGAPVKPVSIQENNKPGQRLENDRLQIYRPQVRKTDESGAKPVPPKVARLNEVKPISERKAAPANRVSPVQNENKQEPARIQNQNIPQPSNERIKEPEKKAPHPLENLQQPPQKQMDKGLIDKTSPSQPQHNPPLQENRQERQPRQNSPTPEMKSPAREMPQNSPQPVPQPRENREMQRPAPVNPPAERRQMPQSQPQQQRNITPPPMNRPQREQPMNAPRNEASRMQQPQQQRMNQQPQPRMQQPPQPRENQQPHPH